MNEPIVTAANRPTLTLPATADTALCCASCLDTLAPDGACMNVGTCPDADRHATRHAARRTLKSAAAPLAFTIRGGVD